jgi:phospholipid-binding lipoprotein MlaA
MRTVQNIPHVRVALVLLSMLMLSACASQSAKLTNPQIDPWEHSNRKVSAFNDALDKAIVKPVAKGYDKIVPEKPKRAISNFFRNLQWPSTVINLLLQGRVEDSLISTGRFLMNSTLGLAGFIDVATKSGIEEFDEDFGQTLAVWGWKESRYIVVPFLGPFTIRDLGGRGIVGYFDPVTYMIREHNNYIPLIVDLVALRAALLPYDQDIENATDPYAFIRDAYLQNREFKIYNEEPPAPDYDSLLEER